MSLKKCRSALDSWPSFHSAGFLLDFFAEDFFEDFLGPCSIYRLGVSSVTAFLSRHATFVCLNIFAGLIGPLDSTPSCHTICWSYPYVQRAVGTAP